MPVKDSIVNVDRAEFSRDADPASGSDSREEEEKWIRIRHSGKPDPTWQNFRFLIKLWLKIVAKKKADIRWLQIEDGINVSFKYLLFFSTILYFYK